MPHDLQLVQEATRPLAIHKTSVESMDSAESGSTGASGSPSKTRNLRSFWSQMEKENPTGPVKPLNTTTRLYLQSRSDSVQANTNPSANNTPSSKGQKFRPTHRPKSASFSLALPSFPQNNNGSSLAPRPAMGRARRGTDGSQTTFDPSIVSTTNPIMRRSRIPGETPKHVAANLPAIVASPVNEREDKFDELQPAATSTTPETPEKARSQITAKQDSNDRFFDAQETSPSISLKEADSLINVVAREPSPVREMPPIPTDLASLETNDASEAIEEQAEGEEDIQRQTSPYSLISRNASLNRPFGPRNLDIADTLPSRTRKMVRFDSSTQVIQFEALTPEMTYSFSDSKGEDDDDEEDDSVDEDEEDDGYDTTDMQDTDLIAPVIEPPSSSRPLPQIPLDDGDNFGFLRSERRGSDPTERSILDAYEADVSEFEPNTPINDDSPMRSPAFEKQFSNLRFDEPHSDIPNTEPQKQAKDAETAGKDAISEEQENVLYQGPETTLTQEEQRPAAPILAAAPIETLPRVKSEPVDPPVGLGLESFTSMSNIDAIQQQTGLFPHAVKHEHEHESEQHDSDKVSPVPSLDRAPTSPSLSASPIKHENWMYDSLGRSSIADEFVAEFDFGHSVPLLSHPAMDKLTQFPDSRQTSPEPDALDLRMNLPPLKSNTFNGLEKQKLPNSAINTFNGIDSKKVPSPDMMNTQDMYNGSSMPSSLAGLFQDNPYRMSLDLNNTSLRVNSKQNNRFSLPDMGAGGLSRKLRQMSPCTNSDDEDGPGTDHNDSCSDAASEMSQLLPRASATSAEPTIRSSSGTQVKTRPSLTPMDVAKIQRYRESGEGLADELMEKPAPMLKFNNSNSSAESQDTSVFGDIDEQFNQLLNKSRGYTVRQDKRLVIARSDTPRQSSASRKISGPVKRIASDINLSMSAGVGGVAGARGSPLPEVKEHEVLPNSDRGRLFVRIVSLSVDLPSIDDKRAKFSLTLDNGIHCITTQSVPLKKSTLLDEEFELTVNDHLEFILTMKAKWTKPLGEKNIAARSPPRPQPRTSVPVAPVLSISSKSSNSPEKRGFASKLFGRKSATPGRQLGANLGAIAGVTAGGTRGSATKAAVGGMMQGTAAPAKDPWDTLVAADGSFARAYLDFAQYEKEVFGRPSTFELPCFNEWVKSASGKKVAPYKIGSVQVQLMFIPRASRSETLPASIKEALKELKQAKQRAPIRRQGFLSQLGGDCKYWRRRYFDLDGPTLVAHSESSRKPRATINLSKAVSVVQATQENMGHDGFQVKFANGETIDFTGSDSDVGEWMASMAQVIEGHNFAPWADLVLRHSSKDKSPNQA